MKRRLRLFMVLAAGCIALGTAGRPAEAYFLDEAFGARPAGMGEAFVAVADDANASLFNPAGFARLNRVELSGMYADLYAGLDAPVYTGANDRTGYNYLSAAVPLGETAGTIGAAWLQFDTSFYQENTFMLSYGRKLFGGPEGISLDAGVTLKYLEWEVAGNDFTTDPDYYPYSDRGKGGFTADAGLLAAIGREWSAGFSVENVFPVDVGLTTKENVPPVFRAGAAYTWAPQQSLCDSLKVSLEADLRDDDSDDAFDPKLGCEAWFFHNIAALRLGVHTSAFTSGLAFRQPLAGSPFEFQVDYAFTYPFNIEGSWGSHRLGMTIRWDPAWKPDSPKAKGPVLGPELPVAQAVIPKPVPPVIEPKLMEPEPLEKKVKPAVLPERNRDKIVIGIETKIFSDYGSIQAVQAVMEQLDRYLRETSGAKFEWKDYSLDELKFVLLNGDVDVVVSYSEFFRGLAQQGSLKPVLTIQAKGSDKQRCCLIVRGDSAITEASGLKKKRLGFMDSDILPRLKEYFFKDVPEYQDSDYFGSIEKHKNAIDSLMALQLENVDAIVAFEYILPICGKMSGEIPQGVKVIGRSELVSNVPVYVRSSASRAKNKKMRALTAALLKYHEQPEAKPFFEFFNFDRFVEWEKANKP